MRFAPAQLAPLLFTGACTLANHPPVLAPLADVSVTTGETARFDVAADDGDGDALTFSMAFLDPFPPDNAALTATSDDSAEFRWSPLASDALPAGKAFTVRFVVEDGYGGLDQADVVVTVFRPGGVPEFRNPPGYVLDLAARDFISFDVQVKDDDSAEVALSMLQAPDGAQLTPLGPKSAEFYWRPGVDQLAAQLFYTVVFSADDGDHAPVTYEVGIVLAKEQP